MKSPRQYIVGRVAAFTLIEVLVSTAIISLIMLVLLSIVDQTSRTWRYTTEKIEKFQEARDGFESMTRKLSQATLNTYWEYLGVVVVPPATSPSSTTLKPRDKNVSTTNYRYFVPKAYGRMSELRFVSGPMSGADSIVTGGGGQNWPYHGIFFQAPFGVVDDTETDQDAKAMNNLLNTWGYFLEVNDDDNRPNFISNTVAPRRWRSRLMEFSQPTENMVLNDTAYTDLTTNWFSLGLNAPTAPKRMLAENVIALIIVPKLSKQDEDYRKSKAGYTPYLSPNYIYDSTLLVNPPGVAGTDPGGINPKNQLPPIVQVTMVALDERSAQRFLDKTGGTKHPAIFGPDSPTLFTTHSELLETPGTGDLATYERQLVQMGLTYRIFSTNVSIRGAKWSRAQTN
jgi:uncharacterized protein (TIGR02599 family)